VTVVAPWYVAPEHAEIEQWIIDGWVKAGASPRLDMSRMREGYSEIRGSGSFGILEQRRLLLGHGSAVMTDSAKRHRSDEGLNSQVVAGQTRQVTSESGFVDVAWLDPMAPRAVQGLMLFFAMREGCLLPGNDWLGRRLDLIFHSDGRL